jgi:hypothetical protein
MGRTLRYAIFIVSPVLWLARIAVFLVFAIPGVLIVAALAWSGVYALRPSRHFAGRSVTQFPWWAWLWSNDEDGVDGLRASAAAQIWWYQKTRDWSQAKRIFVWSALRNPVNHLRYVPVMTPKFHSGRIRFIGLDHEMQDGEGGWFFIWQGLYSAFRYETRHFRFWIGWCFKPQDVRGISPEDTRLPRADFKLQLKRVA